MRSIIELWSGALSIDEGLKLLLGGIASCLFITSIVCLVRGRLAPGLERLAQKHAASSAGSSDQRITVAKFVADQCTTSGADRVTDNARRTNARATRKHCARENRKKKSRVFHYATVIAEYQAAAALKRELLYRLAVEALMEQKCGSHMVFAHDASAGKCF